jgi:hypothetical protein
MEADCKDDDGARNVSPKMEESSDLNKVLSVLTAHITASTAQMSSDFHQVISANDNFKQEVREANENFQREIRDDILELRSLLHLQSSNVPMTSSSASTAPIQITPSLSVTPPAVLSNSVPSITSHSTDDVLHLLAKSFSKITSVMTEKTMESKAEWPKFTGDHKKFRSWY